MELKIHNSPSGNLAEIIANEVIITTTQDALDLLAEADQHESKLIILNDRNIIPDFFNLRTGFAGEILQKFVNYGFRLAIVGDFKKYPGRSLEAFIIECNRGNQFLFAKDISEVLTKLSL